MGSPHTGPVSDAPTYMNKILQNAFNLIPAPWRNRAVIAGGAAACFDKADDIDIFVLDMPHDEDVIKFRAALRAADIPGIVFREGLDPAYTEKLQVVADVPSIALPVQIIATRLATKHELLMDFDISTHVAAITPDGVLHIRPGRTSLINETPKILSWATPERTLVRYRRICIRYGLEPDMADLRKLCTLPDPKDIHEDFAGLEVEPF